jgi:hypothetical protein
MQNRSRKKWGFLGVSLAVLALMYSGVIWAAEAPPEIAPPELQAAPEKRPEKPPEETKYLPETIPIRPSTAPATTLEIGPLTGVLAPYGYPGALDTLSKGWDSHRLGIVGVSPYLGYDALYRTNIFQTSSDKKADFINTINPALRLEMPLGQQNKFSMGYLGNYFIYSRFSNQSHYDQTLNADMAFNFPAGLSLRLGNGLRIATEEATATTGRQRPYDRISPYFLAAYKLADRWKIEANYQMDALLFVDQVDRTNSYTENIGGLTLYYKVLPKTAVLAQYLITYRQYPSLSADDNISHTPLVGLTWDPTAKLSGTVKFGYTFKDYQNEIPGRNNSPQTWALSIQNLYRYSRFTTFSLIAQRSLQEDSDSNNSPYVNTGLFFTFSHYLHFFNVTSNLLLSYYNNHYENLSFDPGTGTLVRRVDNIFNAGAGLSRPLNKWLRLRLDYLYANKGSNVNTFSYNEHKVILGLQASF